MSINLLPIPRSLESLAGGFTLTRETPLLCEAPPSGNSQPTRFAPALERVQRALAEKGLHLPVGPAAAAAPAVRLLVDAQLAAQPQGYLMEVTPQEIRLVGHDDAGLFYAACTFAQYFRQQAKADALNPQAWQLPCVKVQDHPDFPVRGVMLDISRDKVPTMQTLFALIDLLASWKINQFQLYTEHTFAYQEHVRVWQNASPVTAGEIRALDAYCQERFIELVPNQNSFGHMHRWLKHAQYADLAEVQGEFKTPWGTMSGPFSLDPQHPGSLELLRGLYDELLPNFSSQMFNVGCDETFDLGQGRSAEACERLGKGRVYLDFLLKIYREVSARQHTMQFWGDILMQHPELVPELPRDMIALEWGYEASQPPAENCKRYAQAGLTFYVCPGTSSWRTLAGRTDNALGNLRTAAENGLKYGAQGYLITDWGDEGHWQVLPVSYLGFAAGAAYAWCYAANQALDLPAALNAFAFFDAGADAANHGGLGQAAFDLGNFYQAVGMQIPNSSAFFYLLQMSGEDLLKSVQRWQQMASPQAAQAARSFLSSFSQPEDGSSGLEAALDAAAAPLGEARPLGKDGSLLRAEYDLTVRMLRHAVRRLGWLQHPDSEKAQALLQDLDEIIAEYRRIWLLRNRPGGLAESIGRFEPARSGYAKLLLEA